MSSWETSTAQDPSLVQLTLFSVHRNVHSIMFFTHPLFFNRHIFIHQQVFKAHKFSKQKIIVHASTTHVHSVQIFKAQLHLLCLNILFQCTQAITGKKTSLYSSFEALVATNKMISHLQHKAKWLARSTWQWLDSLKHLFSHGQNSLRGFACLQESLKESVALPFQFSASSVPSNVHTMYSLIQSHETVCNRNKKVLNTEKLEKKWMKQTLKKKKDVSTCTKWDLHLKETQEQQHKKRASDYLGVFVPFFPQHHWEPHRSLEVLLAIKCKAHWRARGKLPSQ